MDERVDVDGNKPKVQPLLHCRIGNEGVLPSLWMSNLHFSLED